MKLKHLFIDYVNQTVTCQCVLIVQGNPVIVPFTVPEADLYAVAATRGMDTWENEDVCTVGSQVAGQSVSI
jgi:hypothetical protein